MLQQSGQIEIGEEEKHIVSFTISKMWTVNITISVDGVVDSNFKKVSVMSGPFTLSVGEKEKHEVRIQLLLKAFAGGFRHIPTQIYVDNKLMQTF